MTGVATAAALTLAGIFTWAGLAKLTRAAPTTATFRALGLPAAPVMARAVPAAELALAFLLATRPRAGGLAAILVLAAFTGFLATRDGAVSCGCFGGSPIPRERSAAVARNGLLAVLALLAVGAAHPVAPDLPAVLVVGSTVTTGLVLLGLLDLRGAGLPVPRQVAEGPPASGRPAGGVTT